jgi:predicted esterase
MIKINLPFKMVWLARRNEMKYVCFLLCLWSVTMGIVFPNDFSNDKKLIEQVIDDSIGWFKTKDFNRLFEIFPLDPNLFMFQPTSKSTVIGGKAFRESTALWRNEKNIYLWHKINDLRIQISESGTVAWWSAMLDDCGSYGGQEFCWKNCRWTGVVEKRQGKWVIAQCHFSFARDVVEAEMRAADAAMPAEEFADYPAMQKQVGDLFTQKKYAGAALLLKANLEKFPDHVLANITNLALTAVMQNDAEKAIYWLEEGHHRGLFYSKWAFLGEVWTPIASHARFKAFFQENTLRLAAAQKQASMKLELVKPATFNPKRCYPLFIALHGGGENMAEFKPQWTSRQLQKEFVVAYVQSSQVADMKGFHWQEDSITLAELTHAFTQIQEQVCVDLKQIYIGGFSSGGYGSMIALFSGTIPIKGFIILCPELPAEPDDIRLAGLAKRKIRGTLLTTELDRRIEKQKAFVTRLNSGKVSVQLKITPNIGHWYPPNLPELIDQALKHIRH